MKPIATTPPPSREEQLLKKKKVVVSETKDLLSSIVGSSYKPEEKIEMLEGVIDLANLTRLELKINPF